MAFIKTQYSFAGGELAPELFGRADLEKHATSVALAENMLLREQGGLFSRPGMRLAGLRKYADKTVALVKFTFSPTDNFCVEFGDHYVRFADENGYVTKNGQIYELASPYGPEDFDKLSYDQSGDVIFIACAGKQPRTLTRKSRDQWILDVYKNMHGPFEVYKGDKAMIWLDNGLAVLTQLSGYQFSAQDAGGYFKLEKDFEAQSVSFTQSSAATAQNLIGQIFPCCGTWQLDTTGSWTGTIKLEQSEDGVTWKAYRSYSSTMFTVGGTSTGQNFNSSGEISGQIRFLRINAQNWSSGTAYIQFRVAAFTYNLFGRVDARKSATEAYVTLDNFPHAQISAFSGTVAYENYTLPAMTANNAPEGRSYFVEPGYAGGVTNEDGETVTAYDTAWKARDNDAQTYALVPVYKYQDGVKLGYEFNAAKLITQITARVELPESGAVVMKGWVYSKTAGWKEAGTVEFNASTPDLLTLHFDPVIVDGAAVSFTAAAEGPETVKVFELSADTKSVVLAADQMKFYAPRWGARQGWPEAVRFFQARLNWFNGFHGEMTKIDDYYNFETSLKVKDDDAVSVNIKASGMCTVRHAVGGRKLAVLTDGGEFVNTADVITPSASGFVQQSNYGCSRVRPVVVGSRVMFVALMGGRIYDLEYDYSSDNYQAEDLCALAPHLFEGKKIVQMDYQSDPSGILWVVLDDGTLVTLSYARQHGIMAWTRQRTDGQVQGVCVLPGPRESKVFLAVKRGAYATLEVLGSQLSVSRENAFCVDCGVQKTFQAAQTAVDGLSHLEGRAVSVLADGNVLPAQTVLNGQITLPRPATKVSAGLAFTASVKTLPLCVNTQNGEFTKRLRPVAARVGVKSSAGGDAGMDGITLDPLVYGADGELFTGEVDVNVAGAHDVHPQICIRQAEPLPLNVTKLTVEYN